MLNLTKGITVKIKTDKCTETEAMYAMAQLCLRFGWTVAMFTRDDAAQIVHEAGAEMTDSLWERVTGTWEWRDGIREHLTDHGWPMVEAAVTKARRPYGA